MLNLSVVKIWILEKRYYIMESYIQSNGRKDNLKDNT